MVTNRKVYILIISFYIMINWKKFTLIGGISGALASIIAGGFLTYKTIKGIEKENQKAKKSKIEFLRDAKDELSPIVNEVKEVIQKQEKILGITHFGEPSVTIFPKNYSSYLHLAGQYYPEKDEIFINPYGHSEGTIAHELGHFYTDKLNEKNGISNWSTLDKPSFSFIEENKGKRLISVGIATYFEYGTIRDARVRDLDYKSLEEYIKVYGKEAYDEIGYSLVKPL